MKNIGDKAPEVLGINEKGEEIRLSAYKGKKIVLYFYPKDSTSGCTAIGIHICAIAKYVTRFPKPIDNRIKNTLEFVIVQFMV